MPGIGIGLGIGVGRGGVALPGGTMAAVSSPATFSALGAPWTIGDTSPVLWCRAGEGETAGDTEASIAAVGDWTHISVGPSADGDWTRITNAANGASLEHTSKSGVVDSVNGVCTYTLELRRGAPPTGETANKVRIHAIHSGSDLSVDVNLDTGTASASEFADVDVTPLGADADAGYRVVISNEAHSTFDEVTIGLLLGDSRTYVDATGSGYFRIMDDAAVTQQRAASWADAGEGEGGCVQATAAYQPLLWEDLRGPCLWFGGAQRMSCHEIGATAGGGDATPFTVAMAIEKDATDTTQVLWAFRNSSTGRNVMLVYRNATPRFTLDRTRDDNNTASASGATALPFAGVVVCRYSGTALALKVKGVDASPAAHTGALTTDNFWLCSYDGTNLNVSGRLREFAVWDRSLTDAEANAVSASLSVAWGY